MSPSDTTLLPRISSSPPEMTSATATAKVPMADVPPRLYSPDMPPSSLDAWRCCRRLRQVEIDWLLTRGVPSLALGRDGDGGGYTLVAADVAFHGAGGAKFSFADQVNGEATKTALIVPARDVHGEVSDLVAIEPRTGAVGSWLGVAALLGEHELSSVRFEQPPIHVHENGLDWLRAGRTGLVVIDPNLARWLLHDQPLAVSNRQFAKTLERALSLKPRIIVVRPPAPDGGRVE